MEKNVFARSPNGVKCEVGGGVNLLTPCAPKNIYEIKLKSLLPFLFVFFRTILVLRAVECFVGVEKVEDGDFDVLVFFVVLGFALLVDIVGGTVKRNIVITMNTRITLGKGNIS